MEDEPALPLSLTVPSAPGELGSESTKGLGLVAKIPFRTLRGFEAARSLRQHSPVSQSIWVDGAPIMGLLRDREDSASVCSKKTYFTASSSARPRVITCSRSMLYGKHPTPPQDLCSTTGKCFWQIGALLIYCPYLESFSMFPSDSSLLVIGPSIVRFWLGFSASRECAWTKARPRDWRCGGGEKMTTSGSAFQICFVLCALGCVFSFSPWWFSPSESQGWACCPLPPPARGQTGWAARLGGPRDSPWRASRPRGHTKGITCTSY